MLRIAIANKDKRSRVALVRDAQSQKLLSWALIVSPLRGHRSPKIGAYTRASHRGLGLGRKAVEALLSKAYPATGRGAQSSPLYNARPIAEKWDTASAEFWGSFGTRLHARCQWHRSKTSSCPCYRVKHDGALVFTIDAEA
jgi:GNAT superfamily N-acetyltransferase